MLIVDDRILECFLSTPPSVVAWSTDGVFRVVLVVTRVSESHSVGCQVQCISSCVFIRRLVLVPTVRCRPQSVINSKRLAVTSSGRFLFYQNSDRHPVVGRAGWQSTDSAVRFSVHGYGAPAH